MRDDWKGKHHVGREIVRDKGWVDRRKITKDNNMKIEVKEGVKLKFVKKL